MFTFDYDGVIQERLNRREAEEEKAELYEKWFDEWAEDLAEDEREAAEKLFWLDPESFLKEAVVNG